MNFVKSNLNLIRLTTGKPLLIKQQFGYCFARTRSSLVNRTNTNSPNKILNGSKIMPNATDVPLAKPIVEQQNQMNIFKRFKDAYRKHGKVLIVVHLASSVAWISSFYVLSKSKFSFGSLKKSGFDITNVFNLFERLHLMSHETAVSIEAKINNFNLEAFLRSFYFDKVFDDDQLKWFGGALTGVMLKHILTAVMIYKIFTPIRYLFTLTFTKLLIDVLKRRGVIPIRPPPGSSIKELYEEQKLVLRRSIKSKRENYKFKATSLTSSRLLFKRPINLKASFYAFRKKTPR